MPHGAWLSNHAEVTPRFRKLTVDWLVRVHDRLGIQEMALFLAISIFDRVVSACRQLPLTALQLVAITGMWSGELQACASHQGCVPTRVCVHLLCSTVHRGQIRVPVAAARSAICHDLRTSRDCQCNHGHGASNAFCTTLSLWLPHKLQRAVQAVSCWARGSVRAQTRRFLLRASSAGLRHGGVLPVRTGMCRTFPGAACIRETGMGTYKRFLE